MQNLDLQLAAARSEGVFRAGHGGGRIAMVDAKDVAAVATQLLTGAADFRDEVLDLTGPEALTYAEVASRVGKALGREVAFEPQKPAGVRALFERMGMPDWHVEILLQFNRAFAQGLGARVSNAVERVLARPPRSLSAHLADAIHEDGT